jgi:hypothetical protein
MEFCCRQPGLAGRTAEGGCPHTDFYPGNQPTLAGTNLWSRLFFGTAFLHRLIIPSERSGEESVA